MKKLLNLLLVLVLALTGIASLCACDDGNTDETAEKVGISYTLKTENSVSFLSVKSFGISEEDAKKVSSGNYADVLKTVEIPAEAELNGKKYPVKEIEPSAFANQLIIEKVVIPSSIETIGSACLAGCTSLKELTVPFVGNKVGAVNDGKVLGYLFGSSEVASATSSTVKYNASGSKTYYIPDSLKKITLNGDVTDYAFNGLSKVEEIVVTGNTETIGYNAFEGCSSLRVLTLNQKAKNIGDFAFSGCATLVSFDLSEAIAIGESAFSGCALLGYSALPLQDGEFALSIPASVTLIGKNAFANCVSLKSVDLSQMVADSKISTTAFSGCTALEKVSLSSSATYGLNVFHGCDALEETGVIANGYAYQGTGLFDFAV